jgi:hypothetical protein
MTVERMPQSRSARSALANSRAKRIERISSRSRNSVSSTGSSKLRPMELPSDPDPAMVFDAEAIGIPSR